MSRVLRLFSSLGLMRFLDRPNGSGVAVVVEEPVTEIVDPVVPPVVSETPPVALITVPPVVQTDLNLAPLERLQELERLRQLLRNHDVEPSNIETIIGRCPSQTETQIRDCQTELTRLGIPF